MASRRTTGPGTLDQKTKAIRTFESGEGQTRGKNWINFCNLYQTSYSNIILLFQLIIKEEWEKEQQKLKEEAAEREREKERKEREQVSKSWF